MFSLFCSTLNNQSSFWRVSFSFFSECHTASLKLPPYVVLLRISNFLPVGFVGFSLIILFECHSVCVIKMLSLFRSTLNNQSSFSRVFLNFFESRPASLKFPSHVVLFRMSNLPPAWFSYVALNVVAFWF